MQSDHPKRGASLKRALGLTSGTLLVVGLLIGSGVFKKIVPMSQTGLGGEAIIAAWIVAGAISLFGALTISGLASLTEDSGGMYEYFRIAYGNFMAFLSGWADFVIVGPAGIAALSFLFAQIIHSIVPLPNPMDAWADVSIAGFIYPFRDSGIKLVGVTSIVTLTLINMLGVRASGVVNNIITSAKIFGLFILIAFGLLYKVPDTASEASSNLLSGVPLYSAFLTSMLGAFWAYHGWDIAANISGEMVNPRRNVPLAMTLGVLISMLIYVLTNFTFLRVMPVEVFRSLGEGDIGAFAVADLLFGDFGKTFLVMLLMISVFGALNSNVIAVPRKSFRMAEEGYFFATVKKIHPNFRTPYMALFFTMAGSVVLLLTGSFDMLTDMLVFTIFLFYGLLSLAVLRMKRNGAIQARVIGYPVIPLIFLLFSVVFTINTIIVQPKQTVFALLLIASGLPFYWQFRKSVKASSVSEVDPE